LFSVRLRTLIFVDSTGNSKKISAAVIRELSDTFAPPIREFVDLFLAFGRRWLYDRGQLRHHLLHARIPLPVTAVIIRGSIWI
jgi:hypothetical protein